MNPLVWIVPSSALFLALFPLPYGYYQLLRIVIFVVAIFLCKVSLEHKQPAWPWIFAAMALTYNPVVPISLGREIWSIVNVTTIGLLLLHWRKTSASGEPNNDDPKV
ncbi:DUF6804 family protein [Parasphingorhabdus sp.]|uniref:DUF6804 family protein n=1 Tax=Parasphingorhabdus sp. TaxID=2709688 RepID=UPI003D2A18F2